MTFLNKKFKTISKEITEKLNSIQDVSMIESIFEKSLEINSIDDLKKLLPVK